MENNVTNETKKQEKDEFKSILEEVIREGAIYCFSSMYTKFGFERC